MWRQHLLNSGFKTLYFNAWENDFHDEVVVALLSELEEFKDLNKPGYDSLLHKSAKFLAHLGPSIVKGAVSKFIGDEAVADIAKAASEFGYEELEKKVADFAEKKKGISEFRETLEHYVNAFSEDKPLVFIIDELDRCRPKYSVEVLEHVKHFFSVPGVVFVLSIDKLQLGHAIKGYYGSDLINSEEYLRRFFDLTFSLPEPNSSLFISYLYDYYGFDNFFKGESRLLNDNLAHDGPNFLNFANLLFSSLKLSLRQLEKLLGRLRLIVESFNPEHLVLPDLLLFICYLDSVDPILLNRITEKKVDLNEVIQLVESYLMPITSEERGQKQLMYLMTNFIVLYFNYRNSSSMIDAPLTTATSNGGFTFNFRSKFLEDDDYTLKLLNYLLSTYRTTNINLGYVIKRFHLTAPFQ
ncbi:MAG: hypothetical protein JJ975_04010 [Bacteroidia bacterium]|nr:hypothetical protein [Bacteroidia bacterium]